MFFSRVGGLIWVDRGDFDNVDFNTGNLTLDAAWHDMDLSAIVGTGEKLVLIRSRIGSSTAGKKLQFKTKGSTNEFNMSRCMTQVANIQCDHNHWVYTNADGLLEYYLDDTTWTVIELVVRGCFK